VRACKKVAEFRSISDALAEEKPSFGAQGNQELQNGANRTTFFGKRVISSD